MAEPFSQEYRARWVDMDFNQHMRNAAYLGCAEETRIRFLDAHGFGAAELLRRQIGPAELAALWLALARTDDFVAL